jgi:hypothetical protein
MRVSLSPLDAGIADCDVHAQSWLRGSMAMPAKDMRAKGGRGGWAEEMRSVTRDYFDMFFIGVYLKLDDGVRLQGNHHEGPRGSRKIKGGMGGFSYAVERRIRVRWHR